MEFWNRKDLIPPASCSFQDKNHQIDVKKICQHLLKLINKQANHDCLDAEAALVSRCIYRMKMKFRKDKGLKALEKVNRALKQYLNLDIFGVVTAFYRNMPKDKEAQAYVPTRNMLDYLLVRIMGLSKLCVRIAEVCKECAAYMENKIAIGHFWKVAMIALAVASRIWFYIKDIADSYCKLYQQLLPYRTKFLNTGIDWLPETCELPTNIRKWSNFCIFEEVENEPVKIKHNLPNIDDSDAEIDNNNLDDDTVAQEDVGDPVITPKLQKNKKKQVKNKKDATKQIIVQNVNAKVDKNATNSKQINSMKSFRDVMEFVNEENYLRKVNKNSSAFKNINDQKWEKILQFIKKHEQKGNLDAIEKSKKLLKAALKE